MNATLTWNYSQSFDGETHRFPEITVTVDGTRSTWSAYHSMTATTSQVDGRILIPGEFAVTALDLWLAGDNDNEDLAEDVPQDLDTIRNIAEETWDSGELLMMGFAAIHHGTAFTDDILVEMIHRYVIGKTVVLP